MLATYLTWHLRQALADSPSPTSTSPPPPTRSPPPADQPRPGQRHRQAHPGGLPVYRYRDLLAHLATLDRQTVSFAGQRIEKLTTPTPVQRRVFELLGTAVRWPSRSQ